MAKRKFFSNRAVEYKFGRVKVMLLFFVYIEKWFRVQRGHDLRRRRRCRRGRGRGRGRVLRCGVNSTGGGSPLVSRGHSFYGTLSFSC